jgi:prepilin-type N-terminal cleavage/methylation domain-containing protein
MAIQATSATGSKGLARRAAFTLIELSIVVFIIALMVAVAIPGFVRSYNGMILNEAANSFATLCQLARIQAVSRQSPATLHLDLDRQMLWLSQSGRNQDGGQEDQTVKVVQLSNRVSLVSAVRPDLPATEDKQVSVDFYPNGTCDQIYIVLRGTEPKSGLCAVIDPLTTHATIYAVKPS